MATILTDDSIKIYKVARQPERRVFYHGQAPMDKGYYFCPYLPGMTEEQIREVNEKIKADRFTEFQIDLLKSVQQHPMKKTNPNNLNG